ncbi:MAG: T9SS type A sorting domain-containing protein [Bacteroidota bacterium]|jgi:1,4-alpha-glucan branching enzyme
MKKHLLLTLLSACISLFAFSQTQVDLPVTFDDVNTNYNLADFGGNVSAIVADPLNAANSVCQAEKTSTAQLWAGTTIGGSGLANPIPFAANANKISVRVYSPDAGIIVKLKAEDPNDPTKSVEANLTTTTSNAWETLEFDFTNQAPGTAAINYSYNYQKLSIFFNFGIDGATAGSKTYYCDDITFMPPTVPTIAPITFQVQSPDSTPVWVFGSWSGWSNYPGDAMTPIGNNIWEITLNLPVNANFEYLFVNGATPINEDLNPADPCTNGNTQYTNRTLAVGTTAATYCAQWATCNSCNTTPTTAAITFQVQNPDSTPVWVFGSWSGWSNYPGDAMTPIGNNTWEITLNLPVNSNFEYLFVNGTTPINEDLDPADPCTNGNSQYTNRTLSVGTTAATYCAQWATCNPCSSGPAQVNVTFQVQNPTSTPVFVFGSWSGFGNYPGDVMTPIGNGVYSVTLALNANSNYEYLFVNGATPSNEILDPAWPCTNGNSQYTNRTLAVGGADLTVCAQWQTCNSCTSVPALANVTFQVENPDSVPVYVFGNWNGFSNYPGTPMTSIGNGIYEVTIQLGTNANYEYLFVNGATPVKEVLNPAWPCTNGNGQYTNRTLSLGATDTSVCSIWATCAACGTVAPVYINATFQVQNPDSTPVYLFGSWSGWSNYPGTPMTAIGNNTYEASIQLLENTNYEYLFVNGGTPIKEVLDPAWLCTNGNAQYTNRVIVTPGVDVTTCSKWASCDPCSPTSVNEITAADLQLIYSNQGLLISSSKVKMVDQVVIFDLMGKQVFSSKSNVNTNSLMPVQFNSTGVYLVKLTIDNQVMTFKVFAGN